MQTIAHSLPKTVFLLASISFGALFFRLGSLPLSGADEPRYARIAQEMYEQGNWITPTLQSKPWLEKPPLYYWLTIPFYSLFDSNEIAARSASAICAFVTAIAILFLGSMLWNRSAGLFGASILLTSLGFVGFGRSASTDMPFTCFITLAMVVLAVAVEKDMGSWKVIFAYVFLGLAVLGKGPVAIILAAGTGLCFWLLDERGILLSRCKVVPGLAVTVALCIPWFWLAFQQNGYAFISTFFINHNLARYVTGIHHHSEPLYYYIPILLALFFPWSGWLPLLFPKSPIIWIRGWREWKSGMLFLACWLIFPLLFFSFSDSKLAGYILPSLPPLALLLGVRLCEWIKGHVGRTKLRAVMGLHLAFSAAMAVAAPIYFQREYGGAWKTGLLLAIVILMPSLFTFGFGLRGYWARAFGTTVVQGLLLIMATAVFAVPVLGAYLSARDIAHQALELRQSGERLATFRYFSHSLNYYTSYQTANGLDNQALMHRFAQKYPSSLVITPIDRLEELMSIAGCSTSLQGKQGDLRLVRISCD